MVDNCSILLLDGTYYARFDHPVKGRMVMAFSTVETAASWIVSNGGTLYGGSFHTADTLNDWLASNTY